MVDNMNNSTQPINDLYRYYPSMLSPDDMQESLDELIEAKNQIEDMEYTIAEQKEEIQELERDEDDYKAHKDFVYELTQRYEYYNGRIFNPELDTFLKYLIEDFEEKDSLKTENENLKTEIEYLKGKMI
jgi:hypothetical protein